MAYQRSNDLFNDGWREPGDDCERLSYYVTMAAGTAAGLGMTGWGLWTLGVGAHQGQRLEGLFLALVGALMGGGGIAFFVAESKHWDLRHLTADRVVAGGILFGFALMLVGFQGNGHGGGGALVATAVLIGLGGVVVTAFLLIGLAFAYAPALRLRRRIAGARIERRYAVDEKLNEIDDHPCPRADGFTPVVSLRLRDGRTRTMVCAESTYEIVRVGRQGTAVVRGKRLERFH